MRWLARAFGWTISDYLALCDRSRETARLMGRFRLRSLRCCSAVALTLVGPIACTARAKDVRPFPTASRHSSTRDHTPLSLFPLQTLWTIPLNSHLATGAAPAFAGVRAFF